jgi:amino acid permease
MILGIIIDCGGVPTDDRGYIGARYWCVSSLAINLIVLTIIGITRTVRSSTAFTVSVLCL